MAPQGSSPDSDDTNRMTSLAGAPAQTISLLESPAARKLYLDRLLGITSAASVRTSAQSQVETYGPQCSSIAALASIGSNGTQTHNCERDFQRLQVHDHELSIVPDPHFMDLVVRRKDKLGLELRRHPILLPPDWFCCCYLAGQPVFETLGSCKRLPRQK